MLYYTISTSHDPYRNLAYEEALLESTALANTCVLYLWQNAKTVVIGRNQNALAECDIGALERDGGRLARRLSGGGAVYHDLGNVNFTFVYDKKDEDIGRQTAVIARAARLFGLSPERTGRNDILLDGRKFSGNAFYTRGERAYHHGTLMLAVDTDALSRYLIVSPEKLQSKGIASTRSRVVNLSELSPGITTDAMQNALLRAFGAEYRQPVTALPLDKTPTVSETNVRRYASYDWLYGRAISYTWQTEKRFPWGGVQICLQCDRGRIQDCRVYSDALCQDIILALPGLLRGRRFIASDMIEALEPLKQTEVYDDLCSLMNER